MPDEVLVKIAADGKPSRSVWAAAEKGHFSKNCLRTVKGNSSTLAAYTPAATAPTATVFSQPGRALGSSGFAATGCMVAFEENAAVKLPW